MALNLTPTNPRMSAGPWSLRVTPSSHSSAKSANKQSSKSNRNDAGLSLRHVIGTTANSPNSVDTLPSHRALGYTAGAAAVICSFDEKLRATQRFYRARPTAVPLNPIPAVYGPSTPGGTTEFRSRTAVRESGVGITPYSPGGPDWSDSPGGKTWSARERVKAATCVSFSPDGKYLAVGETGYKPRVLIFSTSKESSPDCPLTCLSDHTFGVRCVAFSPNSQYLASLGAANDGFLYIWAINNRNGSATLYASNKCTSNISQIAWVGPNLVTVGTRHVKVWRTEGSSFSSPLKSHPDILPSPSPLSSHRILYGRNCLLGPMLEGIFTAVVPVSASQAIVCASSGDICLLDDSEGCQRFFKVANAGFSVTAVALTPTGDVVVAGKDGTMKCYERNKLVESKQPETPRLGSPAETPSSTSNVIVAMAILGRHLVTVDDRRFIKLVHPPKPSDDGSPSVELQLPAHGGPVLGVRPLSATDVLFGSFFTWSADGTILVWAPDGACLRQISVELEQTDSIDDINTNELKVVRTCASAGVMITGDRFGVLRIIDEKTGKCTFSLRAHAGEITDIAVYEKKEVFVACCGRDRTVQVFKKSAKSWDLVQTLDEHVGAVTGLLFTSDGKNLISCSSDRTIVVREALSRTESGVTLTAFVILRTITLKATPVSMALFSDRNDVLLLSTVDRSVLKFNLRTGHQSGSFKAADSEGGDAVVLSSLLHLSSVNGQNILAGVSSTDKSLRLYDENGNIIGRDWGHTEGVTDLTIITPKGASRTDDNGQKYLVTVAVDGTVFIWTFGARSNTKHDLSRSMDLMGISPTKDLLANKPPLRRVISQSEITRFRQTSPEQEDMTTPTNVPKRVHRSLEKKTSRFSLAQTPRLEPSPINTTFDPSRRRTLRNRSPSPPSPNRNVQRGVLHRKSSLEPGRIRLSRASTAPGAPSSDISNATDAICRSLRSYRKKLTASSDNLAPETLRDLERELGLTARAVGEKAMKAKGAVDESVMVKLLSQYSERLIEMLDERFKVAAISAREGSSPPGETSAASGEENDATEMHVDRKIDVASVESTATPHKGSLGLTGPVNGTISK